MAVTIDEKAARVAEARRLRGKCADFLVRVERGSLRAHAPWVMSVSWASGERSPESHLTAQQVNLFTISMDRRVARYAAARDLKISIARIGPFIWLVIADPFVMEHVREWEVLGRRALARMDVVGLPTPPVGVGR